MGNRVSSIVQSGINVGGIGAIHVAPIPDRENIGNFESIMPWTALSNDTTGIAVDKAHILGTLSLEFDKVDGTDNKKYAGVTGTIASLDVSRFVAQDMLVGALYLSTLADVDYAFIRLGTDGSHYNEWRIGVASIAPGIWQMFSKTLAETGIAITGDGWDTAAIVYIVAGVMFGVETDTLADIRFDHLAIERARSL